MTLRAALSAEARMDVSAIQYWSWLNHGEPGRERYDVLLRTAFDDLAVDPHRLGSRAQPQFGLAVRLYPVRYSRKHVPSARGLVGRPRHVIIYRDLVPGVVGIGRVLHEAMDIARHLPADYGDG